MERIHLSCECGRNETDGFIVEVEQAVHRQSGLMHTFTTYDCESCGYEFVEVTDQ